MAVLAYSAVTVLVFVFASFSAVLGEAGSSRQLLQTNGPNSLGGAWVNGQGDINDYATISRATRKNAARQVARSAARAWRSGGARRSAKTSFARSYASSLARASQTNANAVAQVIAQSTTSGGDATVSVAVAIAAAFTSGNQQVAIAIAQSISIAINAYGCTTISVAIAQAVAIARSDGTSTAFSQSLTLVQSVGYCANNQVNQANTAARQECPRYRCQAINGSGF